MTPPARSPPPDGERYISDRPMNRWKKEKKKQVFPPNSALRGPCRLPRMTGCWRRLGSEQRRRGGQGARPGKAA